MQKSEIEGHQDLTDNQQGNAAYLVGVYMGDGSYLSSRDIFHLKSIDEDFIDYTVECFKSIDPNIRHSKTLQKQHRDAYGKKPIWHLDVYRSSGVIDFMEITHNRKVIPNVAHRHSLRFVEGLLDSDGWFSISINNGTVRAECGIAQCSDIMFEVYKMLQRQGLKLQRIQTRKLKSGKILKRIRFNVPSFLESGICFHIERKNRKIRSYRQALQAATFNDYNPRA